MDEIRRKALTTLTQIGYSKERATEVFDKLVEDYRNGKTKLPIEVREHLAPLLDGRWLSN